MLLPEIAELTGCRSTALHQQGNARKTPDLSQVLLKVEKRLRRLQLIQVVRIESNSQYKGLIGIKQGKYITLESGTVLSNRHKHKSIFTLSLEQQLTVRERLKKKKKYIKGISTRLIR